MARNYICDAANRWDPGGVGHQLLEALEEAGSLGGLGGNAGARARDGVEPAFTLAGGSGCNWAGHSLDQGCPVEAAGDCAGWPGAPRGYSSCVRGWAGALGARPVPSATRRAGSHG